PERRPWFLHTSLLRPHPPFLAPAPYNAMYDADDVPSFVTVGDREAEAAQHPFVAYMMRHHLHKKLLTAELHPDDRAARHQLRATYYYLMREVDDNLGRLFAALRETGDYENTLIIFTTDHGEDMCDHWMLGKLSYFDQSFHIPLIIRPPGSGSQGRRGHRIEAFTESVDVMPTILEACGAAVPLQCDGFALGDFLAGTEPPAWRDAAVWEMDFHEIGSGAPEHEIGMPLDLCCFAAIRDAAYKYVHFPSLPAAFYDLAADPGERRNLADDPRHATIMLAYAQKLLSRRMAHAERSLTGIQLTPHGPIERPRTDRLEPGMS
ncbi:MAG: sulfatase-like hydrolase/transferase, partial [Gammaproteobacteria bacterium]|nr:sulfatase-like hydrolase/transferase [Gammaproteobacteria bacterium]